MHYNILVVDDSAVMRAMVIRSVRLSGLPVGEVHEAGDGEAGLRTLAEHEIDLALVDLNMPIMDGETMLERIRAEPSTREIPVVIVSTERSPVRIAELRARGAEFVAKPFTAERIRETVLRLTGAGNGAAHLVGDDHSVHF